MGMNSVLFYVKPDCVISKKQLDEIVSRLDTTYEDYVTEDGEDYYRFTVKRPNHLSISNSTAMKIDLSADVSVDVYVDWINDFVDNII